MPLVGTPSIVAYLFPGLLWRVRTNKKEIFLTFDDGPEPAITPQVLALLEKYNAKATFFCLGKNVELHKKLFHQLTEMGHTVGNHTYSHLNGWKVPYREYVRDVEKCSDVFRSELFRPPYGKLSLRKFLFLRKHFRIVMWDVITYDFEKSLDRERTLSLIKAHVKPGSVVVFHDSLKARENLLELLPRVLGYFAEKGFQFSALPTGKL